MSERLRISTSDGKYTVVHPMDGPAYPLRYGEPWPAYEGKFMSNLELALAYDLDAARSALMDAIKWMDECGAQYRYPESVEAIRKTLEPKP